MNKAKLVKITIVTIFGALIIYFAGNLLLFFGSLYFLNFSNRLSVLLAPHHFEGEITHVSGGSGFDIKMSDGSPNAIWYENGHTQKCSIDGKCEFIKATLIEKCDQAGNNCVSATGADLLVGEKVIIDGTPFDWGGFTADHIRIINQ